VRREPSQDRAEQSRRIAMLDQGCQDSWLAALAEAGKRADPRFGLIWVTAGDDSVLADRGRVDARVAQYEGTQYEGTSGRCRTTKHANVGWVLNGFQEVLVPVRDGKIGSVKQEQLAAGSNGA
jgi:hypothetical protein